jgi:MFS transporter, DHA1 family, inner membrane transport protein
LADPFDSSITAAMPGPVAEAMALSHPDPIGAEVSLGAVCTTVAIGCVGLLMLGIQPVILGGLQAAGRLSVPQMGQAATVETLALGVVSGVMAARVAHRRLRLWGLAACLLLALANAAGLVAAGAAFVATRGLAGVASGILVWIAVGLITRRHDASRINAIFLGAQAFSQGAAAALIPVTLGPAFGANAGLWMLGGSAALAPLLLLLVPKELPEFKEVTTVALGMGLSAIAALASGLLMMAGIVGLWIYVEPIAAGSHISPRVVSFAIAASLAAQVVGATTVVALHRWIKPVAGLLTTAAAYLGLVALFASAPSQPLFVTATLAFGFLWTVALALGMPLILSADPSRRAALYGPAATILGSSLGPLLAGAFATDTNIRPALLATTAMFLLAGLATVLSLVTRRRSA